MTLAEAISGTLADVPDDVFNEARRHFTDEQLVKPAATAAMVNYRARFNRAFGVESQGIYRPAGGGALSNSSATIAGGRSRSASAAGRCSERTGPPQGRHRRRRIARRPAVWVTEQGTTHVLGLWEGATENTEVCRELLEDLVRRGLSTEDGLLVVIDGGKAWRPAALVHHTRSASPPRALPATAWNASRAGRRPPPPAAWESLRRLDASRGASRDGRRRPRS